jgi:hypothetical protein
VRIFNRFNMKARRSRTCHPPQDQPVIKVGSTAYRRGARRPRTPPAALLPEKVEAPRVLRWLMPALAADALAN